MGTMTVFQLIDGGTAGLCQQLVAHADTADGFARGRHLFLQHLYSCHTTIRIARAISQEETIELHIGIVVVPRYTDHFYPSANQAADDVMLHATIHQHHLLACAFVIADNVFAANLIYPVDGAII